MPTFDFRCKKCKKTFEATTVFGSKHKPACPKCASKSTEKLLTTPLGIHFKGSGFYKTDSSGAGLRPAEKEEKTTKPSSEQKSTQTPKAKDVD